MTGWLRRDRRGVSTVEFAVTAGAFFALVLLLIEAAWQVAVAAALDLGTRQASRWVATGQAAPAGQTRTAYASTLILRASGLPLDAATLQVTVESAGSFAAFAAGGSRPGLGGPGDVLRYTVAYRSMPITPFGRGLMRDGLQLQLIILAKNEPYPQT
ncbi:TadE/TadG family type IV pilus assembly protein [Paracraurococcus ruber]|uniref:TadE-like domain-containing protein n=1 Tax=Paracraurococcus ruber TaxID=77675 RepID=A0ABS1CVE0_9PROT|nr:TadE/TadG family type IV pilus assembly protein [Paracraurococcus ruber]MBK1658375.1 hypothetical protein [Paracraurococcus ruber]TDG30579.1 hypothetical protein E2C05_14030 [Paracraurococcus ruber]